MAEDEYGKEIDFIESVVETHGVEEALRLVFASSGDVRARRIACLEKACGVSFGADQAAWRSWVDELRARGVVGFGPVPADPQTDMPADPGIISSMIAESTGLAPGDRAGEDPEDMSGETASLLNLSEGPRRDEDVRPGDGRRSSSKKKRSIDPDRMIGNYEIMEKLGEGSMGVVYKARQLSMNRIVAVKLLAGWLSRDKKYVSRFFREAKLAAQLDHANIVRGIDAGSDGGTHYFVMEFVEGNPLGRLLKRRGTFSERGALSVTMQVARALDHAWKHELVHRDIKPDNIILTKKGVAKLADLGLAKSIGADATHMTQTGTSVGTPHYMSPEQVRGEREIDIRSDIYSLGATLYHLVTGDTPFSASTPMLILNKHLTETLVPAHVRNPKVSAHTSSIIEKMMEKDAAERYADPYQLMQDIALVAKGHAPRHAAAVPGKRYAQTATDSLIGVEDIEGAGRGRGWRMLLAAVVLAAAALALYLGLRGTDEAGGVHGPREAEEAPLPLGPEQKAEMKSAAEAVARSRELYKKARIDEAISSLDGFLASARFDESRQPVETEREKLRGIAEKLRRLTAADMVAPRRDAREAKAAAEKAPREAALEAAFERTGVLWGRAEGAFEAGDLPRAFLFYESCREAAEEISVRREAMEACVEAAEEAASARNASEELTALAPTEWRVAEGAFRAAAKKRLAGEFAEAARSFVSARGAYEQHRKEAVKLARDAALSSAREAEARRDRKAALAAYREAARHGADVSGKIARLEDALARLEALSRGRSLAGGGKRKEAADVLFSLLRRWPEDEAASSLLAKVTEQVRKEPPLRLDLGGGVALELVYVLPGRFRMGAADGDPGDSDERPVHEVAITKGFHVGRFEVTQAQYEQVTNGRVTGETPSYWKDPARPVERVSWEDAVAFCRKLSERTGRIFRLPTEAEWEYAARAGTVTPYSFGADEKDLGLHAWYAATSGRETHPAGGRKAGAWGLHDTHGNVWEWCADAYDADFYVESPEEDPKCSAAGEHRVLRGGSWLSKAQNCRSAERIRYKPTARYADVGFRVVCEVPAE